MRPEVIDWMKANHGRLEIGTDAFEAADGADCIVTDCWVSMGDDEGHRHNLLATLSGQRQADGAPPSRTPCSCIACPPIAARK